jgi:hypothetical protein
LAKPNHSELAENETKRTKPLMTIMDTSLSSTVAFIAVGFLRKHELSEVTSAKDLHE